MNYEPTGAFSWDRVFKPGLMSRLITFLGLRKDPIIRFLNYPSFALTILFFLPFFPLAFLVKTLWGTPAVRRLHPFYGWVWLALFGVYRRVWYHRVLRKDEQYLYMAEHFSLMDVPLYGTTWPSDTRALSALEYKNTPMYGWILQSIGTQFIERRDTQKAIADMQRLRETMEREGFSLLVAPTGTRADTYPLPPFKTGVFHLATQVKKPIVPIYLVGLEQLKVGKNFCRPGRVDVVYGEPIRPEDHPVLFDDPKQLLVFVRERMLAEGRRLRLDRGRLLPH